MLSNVTQTRVRIGLRPPLKWAGGKRWQVPHILPLWESHQNRRLVEPFCGGLAVTLSLMPERGLLNDVNPHVINFYRWLQKDFQAKIRMTNREKSFYNYRSRFNRLLREGKGQSSEAAALFYYLNRTGYNGLCRFNQQGEFNVPFGQYRTINYTKDFSSYSHLLSSWDFMAGDFEAVPLEPEDFVYADPPYDVDFTTYAKGGFGWEEQVRTAEWLAQHPGPVVLANQATDRIVKLYRRLKYKLTFLSGPRRISCTGDRTPAKEVLAVRNL